MFSLSDQLHCIYSHTSIEDGRINNTYMVCHVHPEIGPCVRYFYQDYGCIEDMLVLILVMIWRKRGGQQLPKVGGEGGWGWGRPGKTPFPGGTST